MLSRHIIMLALICASAVSGTDQWDPAFSRFGGPTVPLEQLHQASLGGVNEQEDAESPHSVTASYSESPSSQTLSFDPSLSIPSISLPGSESLKSSLDDGIVAPGTTISTESCTYRIISPLGCGCQGTAFEANVVLDGCTPEMQEHYTKYFETSGKETVCLKFSTDDDFVNEVSITKELANRVTPRENISYPTIHDSILNGGKGENMSWTIEVKTGNWLDDEDRWEMIVKQTGSMAVLDVMPGKTLQEKLEEGYFKTCRQEDFENIKRLSLEAFELINASGIHHRDVSLGNIIVQEDNCRNTHIAVSPALTKSVRTPRLTPMSAKSRTPMLQLERECSLREDLSKLIDVKRSKIAGQPHTIQVIDFGLSIQPDKDDKSTDLLYVERYFDMLATRPKDDDVLYEAELDCLSGKPVHHLFFDEGTGRPREKPLPFPEGFAAEWGKLNE